MEARSTVQEPQEGSATDAPDAFRQRLHGMWAAVAGSWREHADYVDARGASMTEKILDGSALQPGDRVLELACGPGGLGLAAAPRVAPGGEVVVSDVVAEMTSIAAARAEALGLRNVRARVLDLEQIDEPDGSYDVVLCREGLMFASDPARAAREIRRVLRPGGRVAIAVWGPRERNPWLGAVLDAASAQFGAPIPPPGVPGPFSLEDASKLAGLLRDADLTDVVVDEVQAPMHVDSFEEWWTRTSSLAGPLAAMLASLPEDATHALLARVHEGVRAYETADGLDFPGVTLLATAHRA